MPRKQKPSRDKKSIPLIFGISAGVSIIIIALATMWNLGTDSEPGQIGPRLAIVQDRIDLGRVPYDRVVRVQFELSNVGDRNLTIDGSTPSRALEGC